jgi:hypothetical protein
MNIRALLIQAVLLIVLCDQIGTAGTLSGMWTTPAKVNIDTYFAIAYPSIAVGDQGKVFVVWQHFSTQPSLIEAQIYFSFFDGLNWSNEVAITDTNGTDWTPEIGLDTVGHVHLVWGSYNDAEIYYKSFDGSTWTKSIDISQTLGESYFPSLSVDKTNQVHIVWHDNSQGNFAVYYRSFDGSTWSDTLPLSGTVFNASFPRISVGMDNSLHLVFHGRRTSILATPDVFHRKGYRGSWAGVDSLTREPLDSRYPDIAVKDSLPVVVWWQAVKDTPDTPFQRLYTSAFDGDHWTIPAPLTDLSRSLSPRIVADQKGVVHAVWELYDESTSTSAILYGSTMGGTWSGPVNISGTVSNPSQARIAVDSAGLCHVVFIGTDNGLYYTHQTSADEIDKADQGHASSFSLEQNYPNPFNSETIIQYKVPQKARVLLIISDVLGRDIKHFDEGIRDPGTYSVILEGSSLSSGVYFYQVRVNQAALTRKMILLR